MGIRGYFKARRAARCKRDGHPLTKVGHVTELQPASDHDIEASSIVIVIAHHYREDSCRCAFNRHLTSLWRVPLISARIGTDQWDDLIDKGILEIEPA